MKILKKFFKRPLNPIGSYFLDAVHTGAYAEQVDTESGVNIWSIHNHLRFRATGSILDSTANCRSQTPWYRSWNKAVFRKMVP